MVDGRSARSQEWHEGARDFATTQRTIFDRDVEMERAAFGDCMSLVEQALRGLVAQEALKNQRGRALLGIAGYAYQLLVSAWNEVAEGRVAAAADHWRTIAEAPDHLTAVWLDEAYAVEWGTLDRFHIRDTKKARKIVKDELNRRKPGLGTEWHEQRGKLLEELQSFSHLSAEASGLVLGRTPGAGGSFFAPEGFQGPEGVGVAGYLAFLAHNLLSAIAGAVGDVLGPEWMQEVDRVLDDVAKSLRPKYGRGGSADATVTLAE